MTGIDIQIQGDGIKRGSNNNGRHLYRDKFLSLCFFFFTNHLISHLVPRNEFVMRASVGQQGANNNAH
jgi:hypothetical protein